MVHHFFCSAERRLNSDPCCLIMIDPSLEKKDTHRVMTRSECSVWSLQLEDMLITLCSSGRKARRSGKQQENNLKISFAGRCENTTTSYKRQVFSSRNDFVDELREIQIPSLRRKEKDSPVSQQQTEMRGLVGGLGWKCEQTGPQRSAATGLQRSRIEHAQKWTIHINLPFPY